VAVGAAYFAWELVLDRLLSGVVPFEVVVAVGEVDVCLVEDSGPLERCSWEVLVLMLMAGSYTNAYRAESDMSCNGIACCLKALSG
jgi:hypothetical protein